MSDHFTLCYKGKMSSSKNGKKKKVKHHKPQALKKKSINIEYFQYGRTILAFVIRVK